MFPPEEQEVVRIRLAESLHAVVSQRLLKRRDGNGRAVAAEVLIVTPAVRDMIADGKRIGEIRDYIEAGREQYGMQTFDQHLADLVRAKEVTFETAMAASTNPSDFELKLRMFGRLSQSVQMAHIEEAVKAAEPPAADGPTLEGITPGGLDFMGS